MLDATRPDLLDVITPPETHLAAITEAAARGVDVICQKPFCRSLAEARAALARAERGGIEVLIHENFRFQPWHRETKRILDAGGLGRLYQATFRLRPGDGQGPRAYLDRQPYFQRMPRFLVHETAIHLIDVFRFLLGEPQSVYADLRRLNPAVAGEDAGLILLDMGDGVRALFDGNRLSDHSARNRRLTMGEMLIEGELGALRLDGDGRLFLRDHGANGENELAYAWQDQDFGGDCVYLFQRHAVDGQAGSAPHPRIGDMTTWRTCGSRRRSMNPARQAGASPSDPAAALPEEDRENQADRAYRELKRLVLDAALPAGAQLLELEAAARLGMSRTPVREAMIRLAQEGMIEIRPRHGMRVLPVSAHDMREIYQVLTGLEATAAALVARRGLDPAGIAAMRQAVRDMDRALDADDLPGWARADERFHTLLVGASGNRRLAALVGQLSDQAHRARMSTLRLRPKPTKSNRDHEALVEAIEKGDPARAHDIHHRHREPRPGQCW